MIILIKTLDLKQSEIVNETREKERKNSSNQLTFQMELAMEAH